MTTTATPNQALQRTAPVCHAGCSHRLRPQPARQPSAVAELAVVRRFYALSVNGNLTLNRIGLLCTLCVALLMVLYYLGPEFFIGPLGIVLLVPDCLVVFIYAIRIFRPR